MFETLRGLCSTFLVSLFFLQIVAGWGSRDKVLLRDVGAITLTEGQWTNARRTPAVPQLKCVGGSCSSFRPQVVQCYNRGSDGYDVQWECKAEMNNRYKFGKIEVSCEGYDHPDDPYILKGSCGLEYTIERTRHDSYRQSGYEHGSYGPGQGYHQQRSQYHYGNRKQHRGSAFGWLSNLVTFGVVAVIVYALYTVCTVNRDHQGHATTQPPPPGFRPEYTTTTTTGDAYTGAAGVGTGSGMGTGSGLGGGFWSGAATGGLLGYLFGNSGRGYGYGNSYGTGYGHHNRYDHGYPNTGYGWGGNTGSWFGGGWGEGSSYTTSHRTSTSSGSCDPGSRTTSGFGGTKRR